MIIGQGFTALVLTALTVLQVAVAGLHTPPHRPHPVDTTAVRRVALLPISIPRNVPNNIDGRHILDSLIRTVLTRSGFEVVSPDIVEPVWRRLADSVGGFYDPSTGNLIAEKWAAVSGAAARELGAWGILHTKVDLVPVRYGGGTPIEYDGVKESMGPTKGEGTIHALSLAVVVVDSSGAPVQCGRSGIQLLAKGSVWDGLVRPVKPEVVFTDLNRDVLAIERGLGGLLQHQPACVP